jgi:hypothetical protein
MELVIQIQMSLEFVMVKMMVFMGVTCVAEGITIKRNHEGECCDACMQDPAYLTKTLGYDICCHFQLQKEYEEFVDEDERLT